MNDKNKETSISPVQNYPIPEEKTGGSNTGSVRIHNNVISMIAHEAAARVPGVVELSGTLVDELADMIGKKSRDRGIRVAVESENSIVIELTVVLEFGVNIPDVCGELQNVVRQSIEDMTGKHVQAVNVSVQSVRHKTDTVEN